MPNGGILSVWGGHFERKDLIDPDLMLFQADIVTCPAPRDE